MTRSTNPFLLLPQNASAEQFDDVAARCRDVYYLHTGLSPYENVATCERDVNGHRVRIEPICEWLLHMNGYDSLVVDKVIVPISSEYSAHTDGHNVNGCTDFTNKIVYIQNKNITSRFTWGHETKHALYDSLYPIPPIGTQEHERIDFAANKFANFLAMPEDRYRERFKHWTKVVTEESTAKKHDRNKMLRVFFEGLATDFQISPTAVTLRGLGLKLVPDWAVDEVKGLNIYPKAPMPKKMTDCEY